MKDHKEFHYVGQSLLHSDGVLKVTGKAEYTGDIKLPGMVYAKVLRPPSHLSKLISVDYSAAEELDGIQVVREKELVDHLSIETRDWPEIATALEQIRGRNPTRHIAFSGASIGMPADIQNEIVEVPEIESIGLGGAALAKCRSCLVVSMGTGSAMVHVDHQKVTHMNQAHDHTRGVGFDFSVA